MRALVLILAVACSPWLAACNSSGGAHEMERSQGVILSHSVDDVWLAARSAVVGMSRGPRELDEANHDAAAVIQGVPVLVRVEEHASGRTILSVICENELVAQEVLDAVQGLIR